jgi:hypothetical protein
MQFMDLNMFYDFIQVLHSKRRLSTKDDHFSKHILFSMIYLLTYQTSIKSYINIQAEIKHELFYTSYRI